MFDNIIVENTEIALPAGRGQDQHEVSDYFICWLRCVADREFSVRGEPDIEEASYRITTTWIPSRYLEVTVERYIESPDGAQTSQKVKFFPRSNGNQIWMVSVDEENAYYDPGSDFYPDAENLARISVERAAQDN